MRVAIILTARPSYAKLKSVIAALLARGVDVQVIACASALLERYGKVVDVVRKDFPRVAITECWTTYDGATLVTSAKETGALLTDLGGVLFRLRVDGVVVCADRHEVLAAAQASSYLHVRTLHLQGGEASGSIDDKIRDAITQLSDVHCVATARAKHRVYGLTGDWTQIHHTGCPSLDVAKDALSDSPVTIQELNARGVGVPVDPLQPFQIVMQHPVTNEYAQAGEQLQATLDAITPLPTVLFWPGQDAGQEAMAKVLRVALQAPKPWRAIRSLPPDRFLRLLSQASVLIGNSSAGIREASFLGTPVVNIGTRQTARERARNVVDVAYDRTAINRACRFQIAHGTYPSSPLYGRGDAGERIAEVICESGARHRTDEATQAHR